MSQQIDILNKTELNAWIAERRKRGLCNFKAVKGPPPVGLTYKNGEPVRGQVTRAWVCIPTGEVFCLLYGKA